MNRIAKLKPYLLALTITFCSFNKVETIEQKDNAITCTENGCSGKYTGSEFINRDDIAHQFSNKMAEAVGNKLKELFTSKIYSKVDFQNIIMTTEGMGTGKVTYYLNIPFKKVNNQCEAYTSFDHVGGWNHTPALSSRKQQLQKALMKNHTLDISNLKTTPEGLQEYWIQWQNKKTQAMCE